jgi:hypothetical protein
LRSGMGMLIGTVHVGDEVEQHHQICDRNRAVTRTGLESQSEPVSRRRKRATTPTSTSFRSAVLDPAPGRLPVTGVAEQMTLASEKPQSRR